MESRLATLEKTTNYLKIALAVVIAWAITVSVVLEVS